jgi:glutamate--cysteine ligase
MQYRDCVPVLMSRPELRTTVEGMDLRDAVRRAFRPARRPGRLGVEVELITVTDTDPPRPVDPAQLARGFDSDFVRAARPSFEPGGQLELSPPPHSSVASLLDELHSLWARATMIARERGARLEAVGTNPYHSCADIPLWTATPRYVAMQAELDRLGPNGRRMMRLTASLQICVDLLPGPAGDEQWLLANLAGPALTVAYANSKVIDGHPTALPGARTRIWQGVDLRRTGYDGRHLDAVDPVGAYHAFAAAAPRLPITASADPTYHLSTLFPPVRPRGGYLEIRFLDAQPLDRVGAAVADVARLLYNQQARRAALDLLLPRLGDHARAWSEAAAGHSPELDELLAIARTSFTGRVS